MSYVTAQGLKKAFTDNLMDLIVKKEDGGEYRLSPMVDKFLNDAVDINKRFSEKFTDIYEECASVINVILERNKFIYINTYCKEKDGVLTLEKRSMLRSAFIDVDKIKLNDDFHEFDEKDNFACKRFDVNNFDAESFCGYLAKYSILPIFKFNTIGCNVGYENDTVWLDVYKKIWEINKVDDQYSLKIFFKKKEEVLFDFIKEIKEKVSFNKKGQVLDTIIYGGIKEEEQLNGLILKRKYQCTGIGHYLLDVSALGNKLNLVYDRNQFVFETFFHLLKKDRNEAIEMFANEDFGYAAVVNSRELSKDDEDLLVSFLRDVLDRRNLIRLNKFLINGNVFLNTCKTYKILIDLFSEKINKLDNMELVNLHRNGDAFNLKSFLLLNNNKCDIVEDSHVIIEVPFGSFFNGIDFYLFDNESFDEKIKTDIENIIRPFSCGVNRINGIDKVINYQNIFSILHKLSDKQNVEVFEGHRGSFISFRKNDDMSDEVFMEKVKEMVKFINQSCHKLNEDIRDVVEGRPVEINIDVSGEKTSVGMMLELWDEFYERENKTNKVMIKRM